MPVLSAPTTINNDLKQTSTKKGLWNAVKYRAHNEDFSKILWEDRFSKERLKEIRDGYLFQGMPDLYSQEYLNYPIDESTSYFRRDDFISFNQDDYEGKVSFYTGVDFAISTREKSDYTVIATVGVTQQGDILVSDIRRGRWDSQEIIEEMFSVQRRYKPELFITETGAIEKAIGPFLKKQMIERGVYLNLYPMVPTKDKLSRARSLQARMRAGGIRFNKDASWYPILEDEMARFPKDRHDDQVDALSWIGLVLDRLVEAPSQEEEDEDAYLEMLSESNQHSGRNYLTGY
jgi:predicted phage terminase large subunit-like protein